MARPVFKGDPASKAEWQAYFDAKIADPNTPVDNKMPGRPRVPDDRGNYFTRAGTPCCLCGQHRNYGPRDENGIPSSTPASDKPTLRKRDRNK